MSDHDENIIHAAKMVGADPDRTLLWVERQKLARDRMTDQKPADYVPRACGVEWGHHLPSPDDRNGWIIVQVQIVGTLADYSHSYTSDMAYQPSRDGAIRHGVKLFGHDDFLIGHVRNGRLELLAWQDEDRDDPDELADAARQLRLTSSPTLPGPAPGRPHQPIVAALALGGWGVYCDACSYAAQDFVYPCKVRPDGPWPPGKLYAREEVLPMPGRADTAPEPAASSSLDRMLAKAQRIRDAIPDAQRVLSAEKEAGGATEQEDSDG